jgi:NO-binding membrane sensor protein with MHYT domain
MSIDTMPAKEFENWEGRFVPTAFSSRYVVLSCAISYIGVWTTLELLQRRTARRGYYNWHVSRSKAMTLFLIYRRLLLIGSSTSMGGVAIWCMHFVGNYAIKLGDSRQFPQIAYSLKFTVASFFLPVIVLFFAFWAVGSNEKIILARVILGGLLAGLGICGMHYVGQFGVSNYVCTYAIGYVIGSAILAVTSSTVAIGTFFVWRSKWDMSWKKRVVCAVILSVAVSSMHWLAVAGTRYRLIAFNTQVEVETSRNDSVLIVILLVS